MYDTLTQMGVAVVQLHAEAGTGQFEFVTGHGPPMQVYSPTIVPTSESCVASMAAGCKGSDACPPYQVASHHRLTPLNLGLPANSKLHTQAAENLLLTREAIRGVASKHGKVATCLPKLTEADSGNGAHLHWSLQTVRSPSTASRALNLSLSKVSISRMALQG